MKKLFSLMMFICMVTNVMMAQDEVSDKKFYVGGSIGFNQNSYDGDALNSTIEFSPEFGYNINEKLSLGLAVGYSRYTDKAEKESKEPDLHTTAITITPYVRYAFYRMIESASSVMVVLLTC